MTECVSDLDDLTMQIKRLSQPAEFRGAEGAQSSGPGDPTAHAKRPPQPSESRAAEEAESRRIMDWVKGKIQEPPQVRAGPPATAAAGDAEMATRIRQILADQSKPKPPPPPPSAPRADSAATLEAVRRLLDASSDDAETLQQVRRVLDVQQTAERCPIARSDGAGEPPRRLAEETTESQRLSDFLQGAPGRKPEEAKEVDGSLGGIFEELADLQQTQEELERVSALLKFAETRQARIDRYVKGLEPQHREGPLIEELDD